MVRGVAGRVDHLKAELGRVELLGQGGHGHGWPRPPCDATVELWLSLGLREPCDGGWVGQRSDVELSGQQPVVPRVVFVVVRRDALPHAELTNEAPHVPRQVGRARVHQQPVDQIDPSPINRPPQHGAGHPEIANLAVGEGDDHTQSVIARSSGGAPCRMSLVAPPSRTMKKILGGLLLVLLVLAAVALERTFTFRSRQPQASPVAVELLDTAALAQRLAGALLLLPPVPAAGAPERPFTFRPRPPQAPPVAVELLDPAAPAQRRGGALRFKTVPYQASSQFDARESDGFHRSRRATFPRLH